ncbi:MAG TPA: hypothetical protein VIJ71_10405, partial [Mycobacteriales bacterium]
ARADRSAPLAEAFAHTTELRSDGGSWGVVAALVDAKLAAVQQQLDALLASPARALALPAGTAVDGGGAAVSALLAAAAPAPAGTAPAFGRSSEPGASSQTAPSDGGGAPTPTPSSIPLVQTLVNTVTGLLPHPGSTPAPSASTPRPAPSASAGGGLLGGVLGSLLGSG